MSEEALQRYTREMIVVELEVEVLMSSQVHSSTSNSLQ